MCNVAFVFIRRNAARIRKEKKGRGGQEKEEKKKLFIF